MNLRSLRRSPWKLPMLLGVSSLFALLAALVAEGVWDWLASLLLVAPIALVAGALLQQETGKAGRHSP